MSRKDIGAILVLALMVVVWLLLHDFQTAVMIGFGYLIGAAVAERAA